MKWLFLLIIVSCGHQEPTAKDLEDNDGDSIVNAYEMEDGKNIAEFARLNPIQGTLSYGVERQWAPEIAFTTREDLDSLAYKLLSSHNEWINTQDYFTENSKINLAKSAYPEPPQAPLIDIRLQFESTQKKPGFLVLVEGDSARSLAAWNSKMEIRLSRSILTSLLTGKAYLKLIDSEATLEGEKLIKEKANRIYHHDGADTKVLYASKKLAFGDYLKRTNLAHAQNIDDVNLVVQDDELEGWWYKDTLNGDKVVLHGKVKTIKELYLVSLAQESKTIERVNGFSQRTLSLKPSMEKTNQHRKYFLRIKPLSFTTRQFVNSNHTYASSGGGGREGHGWECNYTVRSVSAEHSLPISEAVLFSNLKFSSGQQALNFEEIVKHLEVKKNAAGGTFWEIVLEFAGEDLIIGMNNQDPASYDQTGTIASRCGSQRGPVRAATHPEAKLSFEVTAFLQQ